VTPPGGSGKHRKPNNISTQHIATAAQVDGSDLFLLDVTIPRTAGAIIGSADELLAVERLRRDDVHHDADDRNELAAMRPNRTTNINS
jgi:hypothetical protein